MIITFGDFIHSLSESPELRVATLLILGVLLVNGWTDAPNAIVSLVASGGMELKKAVRMAAFFNFAGLALITAWNAEVAFTICHMVDFGDSPEKAMMGLCAALTAIILWSAAAWCFGIPTSESHALIAGLTGAAVSMHNGFAGVNGQEWVKVLYGLAFSTLFGLGLGWGSCKMLLWIRKAGDYGLFRTYWKKYRKGQGRCGKYMHWAQIAGAAAMAFMHGAQDGQKFMGVFFLAIFLCRGEVPAGSFHIPLWMTALCSLTIGVGTAIGGDRIIRTVGVDMVRLQRPQAILSDISATACLLLFSLSGIPVSTTHVKTTAIMGAGMASDTRAVDGKIVKEMILAWLVTFPFCGVIGYLTVKFFIWM